MLKNIDDICYEKNVLYKGKSDDKLSTKMVDRITNCIDLCKDTKDCK